jgi:hypothetical protein
VLADPLFLVPARPGTNKGLCTDASKYGVGAALLQWENEEKGLAADWIRIAEAQRSRAPVYDDGEGESGGGVWVEEVPAPSVRRKV